MARNTKKQEILLGFAPHPFMPHATLDKPTNLRLSNHTWQQVGQPPKQTKKGRVAQPEPDVGWSTSEKGTGCATGAGRRLVNFRRGRRLPNPNRSDFFQPRRLECVTNPLEIGVGQPTPTTCTFGYLCGGGGGDDDGYHFECMPHLTVMKISKLRDRRTLIPPASYDRHSHEEELVVGEHAPSAVELSSMLEREEVPPLSDSWGTKTVLQVRAEARPAGAQSKTLNFATRVSQGIQYPPLGLVAGF